MRRTQRGPDGPIRRPRGGCSWKPNDQGRYRCTTGTKTRLTATCDAYANYRPWLPDKIPTDVVRQMPAGTEVRWRYITKYGFTGAANVPFVMVKDETREDGYGSWVFVYQHCITDFPGYTTNSADA